ncbi:MAG: hypothetical protein ACE1ZM_04275 [Gammaproteobacteria bacterium]
MSCRIPYQVRDKLILVSSQLSAPLKADIVSLGKDCTPRAGFALPDNPIAFPPSMVVIPTFAGMTSTQQLREIKPKEINVHTKKRLVCKNAIPDVLN